MLEVDCSVLTPRAVFKASGHIDRFADWMCKDPQTGEMMRADHFVEDVLQTRLRANREARGQSTETAKDPKRAKKAKSQKTLAAKLDDAVVQEYEEVLAKIDNFDGAGLAGLIDKYDLRCPSGERPTPPMAFNLMCELLVLNIPEDLNKDCSLDGTTRVPRVEVIANTGMCISPDVYWPKQPFTWLPATSEYSPFLCNCLGNLALPRPLTFGLSFLDPQYFP